MAHRAFALAEPGGVIPSFEHTETTARCIVFVCTGQGAQWLAMGKELLATSERVREDIKMMDAVLQGLTDAPTSTIEGM